MEDYNQKRQTDEYNRLKNRYDVLFFQQFIYIFITANFCLKI